MLNFLSDRTGDLDRQIEALEAEAGTLTVTLKKGKKNSTGADRVAEVERKVERHKWHQGKLELIMRLLENGQLETEQVERIKEDIKWYVESNEDVDFVVDEDENIYDELNLDVEIAEEVFGMGLDNDRMSSQDTMSIADDASDLNVSTKGKEPVSAGRRPSTQVKSPMPAIAQLHTPATPATPSNGSTKPSPAPARPATELKYAAAATAAAAADKTVGIAPLPPPPGSQTAATPTTAHGHYVETAATVENIDTKYISTYTRKGFYPCARRKVTVTQTHRRYFTFTRCTTSRTITGNTGGAGGDFTVTVRTRNKRR
jgi:CCR4-NOT transcription complex subunit 3